MRVKGVSEGCGVVVWGKEGYFSQISDSLSATRRLSWCDSFCLFRLRSFTPAGHTYPEGKRSIEGSPTGYIVSGWGVVSLDF